MDNDLDFTDHFSARHVIPEQNRTAAELKRIDELGTIGEEHLRKNGSYVNLVTGARRGRPLQPSECIVLVVEDDDSTASLITTVLEKGGYHSRRARNRKEIADGLGMKPRPSLILLDVMMPDANGFDVLSRIRGHTALEMIPVIMLTSLSEKKDVTNGLLLGADGYLTKPLLPSNLLDAVKAITSG